MHIAVGSLAPQNGFAAGLAFVEHKNFANEVRTSIDIDALASSNGSWRAGTYIKAYRQPGGNTYGAAPLLNLYSQSISLSRVDFYGLGPNTIPLAHTTFGFSENITGANLILPTSRVLYKKLGLGLLAEINGRFPSVRAGSDSLLPSIGTLFTESAAPGLARQAPFIQASEGIRLVPTFPKDPVRLNYLVQFQQFIAPGNSVYSFRRFNADLSHEIPIYDFFPAKLKSAYYTSRASVIQYQGPDDCTAANAGRNIPLQRAASADAKDRDARPCPIISTTRQLEGSVTLRAFISESFANRGNFVPFYFSPTMGGSDINGTAMLSSYPDYRFRGPDLILFRGTVEHSLGKLPLGTIFSIDEGKIATRRDDVNFDHLRHTFGAGLTIHAGGLPVISLVFAWGGHEGTHTTANVSPTLLGGSSRPSLF
ncbi:MAG TPA: hypothetical protein VGN16_23110 [Acidobacteriaceae bacterium]